MTYIDGKTIRHETMQTKLTLRLDDELIAAAKAHAAGVGKSLSQMVAEYFEAITSVKGEPADVSPTIASLRGCIKGSKLDESDYYAYLERKYLGDGPRSS